MSGLRKVQDDFSLTMNKMIDRTNSPQAGFARIYKIYQRLQTQRFMTENQSEGGQWDPLDGTYQKYKTKRYGGGPKRGGGTWKSWPGNGTKMLIGTGTLAGAVIGPGSPFNTAGISSHKVLFTKSSMEIRIEQGGTNAEGRPFNYAGSVDEKRPFMEFSDQSLDLMKEELTKFVIGVG
jgi:hypothetical protein